MEVSKVNNLSFYNDQGTIVISAKQFDTGRKFIFNILNDYEMFDLTDCTVYLRIKKADGTEFQGSECCIIEDTQIIVDTSVGNGNQILAAAGSNLCEINLTDADGKSITTWNFVINVEPRVHNGEGIQSTDSWDKLDKYINDLDKLDDLDKYINELDKYETVLNSKAPLDSPELTGIPQAPTAPTGTNTNQIATTAFVQDAIEEVALEDVVRNDTSSTIFPNNGSTFTAVKSVSSDTKGRITGVETETITLPTLPNGDGVNIAITDSLNTEDSNTALSATAGKNLQTQINTMKSNFQDGVDSIYDKIVSAGTTPSSKSVSDVVNGIGTLSTNRYNDGRASIKLGTRSVTQSSVTGSWTASDANLDGLTQIDINAMPVYNNGITQGQNDVKNNPNNYGLYTKTQYDNNYTSGYNAGVSAASGGANLVAENIKAGVNILGVTGTFTSDADATASNILLGKTAYVNGNKIEGRMLIQEYTEMNGAPKGLDIAFDGDGEGELTWGGHIKMLVPEGYYPSGTYVEVMAELNVKDSIVTVKIDNSVIWG